MTTAAMLATTGSVATLKASQYAFEGKWDGYRLLVEADHGVLRCWSRSERDVTKEYPHLQALADELADHHVIIDGEAVVLDKSGVPSFNAMQNKAINRTEYWAFDLLHLDGHSLLNVSYQDRRRLLEALSGMCSLTVPAALEGDGAAALQYSAEQKLEGVVAKRLDSKYQPGRSPSWLKDKHWNMQEIVIGGWKAGEGSRADGIGALLMGIPGDGGLQFAGRVGTGFTERDLANLKATLEPLHTNQSPFVSLEARDAKGVTFVEPVLVGEVRYCEALLGRMRQPSWRGLRPDKEPHEVIWE
jgi:bifunctional non-homologous end joining protein LigD